MRYELLAAAHHAAHHATKITGNTVVIMLLIGVIAGGFAVVRTVHGKR